MSKLFAFEDLDESTVGGDLEAAPEVGEVADVQVDVEQDVGEMGEQVEAIDEGVEAGDQMEQVEALVEQAAEEGEGLDPVAAEALRIAVESICHRVGANPKSFYALYATENFQSASSRKANTRFALEGVQEFLKDLWKKIKAALDNLWGKVKAFWEKHVSSLGRAKSALESMKKKVSSSSGKFDGQAYIEKAPGFILSAFPVTSGDVTKQVITAYIAAHTKAEEATGEVVATTDKAQATAAKAAAKASKKEVASEGYAEDITNDLNRLSGEKLIGAQNAPMVGGVWLTYNLSVAEGDVTVTVEESEIEDKLSEAGVMLMEKTELLTAIGNTLSVINASIKAKGDMDKAAKAFENHMNELKSAVNGSVSDATSAEAAKALRKSLKAIYTLNTKQIQVTNKVASLDVRLTKAVLGYAGLCLKRYK